MDFSTIFQLRTKKVWWMDVIFYFVISFLLSAIFCYFVFFFKNILLKEEIRRTEEALKEVGTQQQLEYEKFVFLYQRKIKDLEKLLSNHEFASTVFAFMEENTLPNIWFKQFSLERRSSKVQVLGEAEDMEALSRQMNHFEQNEYVQSLGGINSSLTERAKTQFNLSLVLKPQIFEYKPELLRPKIQPPPSEISEEEEEEEKESEKLITVFNLLLTPEVVGVIEQETRTITLEVPYGTDLRNIQPLIIVSRGAKVSPPSGVAQDFSNPLTYRVTGEDGSFQDYRVIVKVLPPTGAPKLEEERKERNYALLKVILLLLIIVSIILIIILILRKRFLKKKNLTTSSIPNIPFKQ